MKIDTVYHGDCIEVLKTLPDNSVDSVVTDPPAGISFMGKEWDNPDYFPYRDRSKEAEKSGRDVSNYSIGYARGRQVDNIDYSKKGRDGFISFMSAVMSECLRVLKPGGHALVWALPRTSHWTATALEDAGFEIRDCIYHIFGSGFPKSHDISKAIDRIQGAEREVIGDSPNWRPAKTHGGAGFDKLVGSGPATMTITRPASPDAIKWDGWGTALKPAVECWWLVRKPVQEKSIAAQVLETGTGAINIDGCRVGYANEKDAQPKNYTTSKGIGTLQEACREQGARPYADGYSYLKNDFVPQTNPIGRFPSHLLLSHSPECTEDQCIEGCPVWEMDSQSGYNSSKKSVTSDSRKFSDNTVYGGGLGAHTPDNSYTDSGGASRYFQRFLYTSKASKRERNAGCEDLPEKAAGVGETRPSGDFTQRLHPERGDIPPVKHNNNHPTVKPLQLMQYLVRMITPPNGITLDPFLGSGTTAVAAIREGFHFVGIEQQEEYIAIATARIKHAAREA